MRDAAKFSDDVTENEGNNSKIPRLPAIAWERLERAARYCAATAGFTAMGYYRNALDVLTLEDKSANPSTIADESATTAVLQILNAIDPLASELGYNYRVFAEELDNAKVASRVLRCLEGNPVFPRIRTSTEEFRHNWERSIAILVDAIDGTVNFEANLPFFCSAVSIFIGGQLCIGAVYDPFHNQVFYGSLRHFPDGAFGRVANVWSIQSGNLEVLGSRERHSGTPTLLGMHITRSDDEERRRFLEFLPFLLAEKELNGGTYMLNSGEMSLAHVASRNLSAFLNNYTKIWDVAAGEVLVRAIGGKVTDFRGNAIDYGAKKEISVVASENPGIHRRIRNLIDRHYRFGAANNTC